MISESSKFAEGLHDDMINRHLHIPGPLPSDTSHVAPDNTNAAPAEDRLDYSGPDA
jgi:hypothetical protein